MNGALPAATALDEELDVKQSQRLSKSAAINDAPARAVGCQISLRGLLLLVAGICALLAAYIAPAVRRHRAVNAVLLLGGKVAYREDQHAADEFGYIQPIVASFEEHRVLDDFFKTVVDIDLRDTHADDATCRQLLELPSLEAIDLADTNVTDTGATALATLREISQISLDRTDVGDETLFALCSLRHLTWITLSETRVTDDGVLKLLAHVQLSVLALDGTRVTDSTVGALASQTKLTSLFLYDTDASVEALDELDRALPECIISY